MTVTVDQGSFYDDIASYYDLIYEDWSGSMRRHGRTISTILGLGPSGGRILDVSSGIGTQSLPLATLGYEVVARDVSAGAINRLQKEARERALQIDAAPADMRDVSGSVDGLFDAVISFDNAVPHLLTDDHIIAALRDWKSLLTREGVILISIRDYDSVDRSKTSVHRYGERVRDGNRYRMSQEWEWYDASHYCTTMIVEEGHRSGWKEVVRTVAAYYAIPVPRLLWLLGVAGLQASPVEEPPFFQPILRGYVA